MREEPQLTPSIYETISHNSAAVKANQIFSVSA